MKVAELEASLGQWEPSLIRDLTDNRQLVNQFDRECQDAFQGMRTSLSDQFRLTEMYEQQVNDRNEEFQIKVFDNVLVTLEKERDLMEKDMTSQIIEFNMKVHQEAQQLDSTVKSELHALREELDREKQEREAYDQSLLESVSHFLLNLQ